MIASSSGCFLVLTARSTVDDRIRGLQLGPLGRRMLLAFVLVAASSVVVLTVAALIGVGRGIEVSQKVDRRQATVAVATAAGNAYGQAGPQPGRTSAGPDLSRAGAVAEAAGARLVVLDGSGVPVGGGSGGPSGQGKGPGPAGGAGVSEAPVTVNGDAVGTVRLVFPAATGTGARDVAWSWVAAGAVVALPWSRCSRAGRSPGGSASDRRHDGRREGVRGGGPGCSRGRDGTRRDRRAGAGLRLDG